MKNGWFRLIAFKEVADAFKEYLGIVERLAALCGELKLELEPMVPVKFNPRI